jgi:hypothetical protein
MKSSRAAVDLIVEFEIGSKALYDKKYRRPEWPGVQSGITVGIGYDLGYNAADTILNDWSNFLPPNVVRLMQKYAGITGSAAKAKLHEAKMNIDVPWDAAMAVFMKTSLPKFEAITQRACPGSEDLPAGCFGVLTSLSYNRGASYTKAGDRYREMRNIRAHISNGDYEKVPNEIRSMKRLWPTVAGLRRRRDAEAKLWEASLKAAPPTDISARARVDTGDDKEIEVPEVTSESNLPRPQPEPGPPPPTPNVQPQRDARYNMEVELIQRALIDMKYFEVGEPDGIKGGKFVAGVAAFMTDRGKDPNKGELTDALRNEINIAKAQKMPDGTPWSRPIAPARANATAKDIAPTVASVTPTWYAKIGAFIIGIPSAVTGMVKSFFGDKSPPSEYVQPIKDFFGAIPSELYWFAVAAIALGIFLAVKKAQDATVKDYQQGKIN